MPDASPIDFKALPDPRSVPVEMPDGIDLSALSTLNPQLLHIAAGQLYLDGFRSASFQALSQLKASAFEFFRATSSTSSFPSASLSLALLSAQDRSFIEAACESIPDFDRLFFHDHAGQAIDAARRCILSHDHDFASFLLERVHPVLNERSRSLFSTSSLDQLAHACCQAVDAPDRLRWMSRAAELKRLGDEPNLEGYALVGAWRPRPDRSDDMEFLKLMFQWGALSAEGWLSLPQRSPFSHPLAPVDSALPLSEIEQFSLDCFARLSHDTSSNASEAKAKIAGAIFRSRAVVSPPLLEWARSHGVDPFATSLSPNSYGNFSFGPSLALSFLSSPYSKLVNSRTFRLSSPMSSDEVASFLSQARLLDAQLLPQLSALFNQLDSSSQEVKWDSSDLPGPVREVFPSARKLDPLSLLAGLHAWDSVDFLVRQGVDWRFACKQIQQHYLPRQPELRAPLLAYFESLSLRSASLRSKRPISSSSDPEPPPSTRPRL